MVFVIYEEFEVVGMLVLDSKSVVLVMGGVCGIIVYVVIVLV